LSFKNILIIKTLFFTFFLLQIGEFNNNEGEYLEKGQIFRLDLDGTKGDNTRVMLPHPEIIEASNIGNVLLVNDGKVKLKVIRKGEGYLTCMVEVEGKLSNRKVCYFVFMNLYNGVYILQHFIGEYSVSPLSYYQIRVLIHQTLY